MNGEQSNMSFMQQERGIEKQLITVFGTFYKQTSLSPLKWCAVACVIYYSSGKHWISSQTHKKKLGRNIF